MTSTQAPTTAVGPADDSGLRERQIAVLGSSHQLGQVIYALAELGVADLLSDGPCDVAVLAEKVDADASALARVLRCAAAFGIFAERLDGRFELTPLAEGLRSERVGGLRPMVLFSAGEFTRQSYAQILHSVRTGEPAFDKVFGMPFHKYLETHPDVAASQERFHAHWSRRLADRFVGQLGLERFVRIADIGGGTGYFMARMIEHNATASGVLFDLPTLSDSARRVAAEHGVADRIEVVAGDLLADPLPAGCDLYTLKTVLHRWRDDQCEVILRRIRAAMGDTAGRVIVIDQIVPAMNQWDHAKVIDIDTLVLYGGMERSLLEWQRLFASAGFELANTPEPRGWSVLELRPCPQLFSL